MFVTFLYTEAKCYLLVSVYDIAWVKVLGGFEQLIHDVTFMYILKNAPSFYNVMQISLCNLYYNLIIFFDNYVIRLLGKYIF